MHDPVIFKEYEKIEKSELQKEGFSDDFEGLEKYLKDLDLAKALHIGAGGIKADSYVGVIKYKKFQFQILPKLINKDEKDNNNIIKNLVFMLSYTKELDIKTNAAAKLSCCRNPFLEVLIREFCTSLFDALKQMTPKSYVREEDNLNFLRGKLKFSENIRYNAANQAKFYCEFDEFSEDNILNQLFLFVSTCLYNVSQDNKNKSVLKLIIDYFCDIKLVKFDRFKAEKIILKRNQQGFKKPFHLAKMFVEHSSVDLSANKMENITLVWDMNKLFEEFVYEVLRRHQNDNQGGIIKVEPQKCKKLLKDDNSKKRNTYVDIFVTVPNRIVVDTKYKKFKSMEDFNNADVFQVMTYCLLHDAKKAVLVYPKYLNYDFDPKIYFLNNKKDDIEIKFITVDLQQKDLKESISEIAKELKNKIIKEWNNGNDKDRN